MMRSIETIIARCVPALGFACLALASCWASAATHEGTWKFERSMDYYGRTPANAAPPFPHLVVRAQEVSMSANCVAKLSMEDYAFSDVFQPLTREGGTAKQLDGFLAKNFGLTLGKVTTVYSITSSQGNCARPVMEFFQVGDRLLMPIGVTFYSYVKDETTKPASSASAETGNMVLSKGYKITPLPLDFNK